MSQYTHILFATDHTELSNNIVPDVNNLAELFSAKVSLITVLEHSTNLGYPSIPDVDSPISEQLQLAMTELGDKLQVPRKRQYIVFGSVKDQVLSHADSLHVDLIVVGSHGRHGLSRLLGSSANAIVNGAQCDVLVLRAHD